MLVLFFCTQSFHNFVADNHHSRVDRVGDESRGETFCENARFLVTYHCLQSFRVAAPMNLQSHSEQFHRVRGDRRNGSSDCRGDGLIDEKTAIGGRM